MKTLTFRPEQGSDVSDCLRGRSEKDEKIHITLFSAIVL